MQNVQTFLCDKHPLLKMFRIEVSEEGKQEKFEVFKCPKPGLQTRTARDTYHWECSLWRDFDVRVFSMLVGQFRVRLSAAGDA